MQGTRGRGTLLAANWGRGPGTGANSGPWAWALARGGMRGPRSARAHQSASPKQLTHQLPTKAIRCNHPTHIPHTTPTTTQVARGPSAAGTGQHTGGWGFQQARWGKARRSAAPTRPGEYARTHAHTLWGGPVRRRLKTAHHTPQGPAKRPHLIPRWQPGATPGRQDRPAQAQARAGAFVTSRRTPGTGANSGPWAWALCRGRAEGPRSESGAVRLQGAR